jgi:hypothetical protein
MVGSTRFRGPAGLVFIGVIAALAFANARQANADPLVVSMADFLGPTGATYFVPEPTDPLSLERLELVIGDAIWDPSIPPQSIVLTHLDAAGQSQISDVIDIFNAPDPTGTHLTAQIVFTSDAEDGPPPPPPTQFPVILPPAPEATPLTLLLDLLDPATGTVMTFKVTIASDADGNPLGLPQGISDGVNIMKTPEPGTLVLLGWGLVGLVGLAVYRRTRR